METSTATTLPERPPLPDVAPDAGAIEVAVGGQPVLARIADLAETRDRLAGQMVVALATAQAEDLAVSATRLSLQVWVEQVCRLPARDAKALLADVDVLRSMPSVLAGLRDGRLSWSQVQQLCKAARTVTVARRDELDAIIDDVLDEYRTYHPDELVGRVWQITDSWQPSRLERLEQAAEADEFLAVQPNFEGGGSLFGQFGPESFAVIGEALHTPLGPPINRPDSDDPEQAEQVLDELDARRRRLARQHGRRAAARLVQLCRDSLAGTTGDGARIPARPTALIVTTLDGLLDRDRTPGWLLHTMAGGRMRATTALLNRMIDTRGADLRLLVFDDHGQAIGVGKKTSVPPGWLRETVWAQHLTDQAPGSTTPVRRCDLDHITP